MNFKSWQEILNEYTRTFENCRYDHITKDAQTYIADVMSTDHQMDNNYYRSFGTYRHDILADTSIIKINETKLNENDILENFYNITGTGNYVPNYIFSGIVLNKNFAANGNEVSLEDIFAEFGYDYLKACDSSLIAHHKDPIYFEQSKIEDGQTIPGGYYEIVPTGNKFYEKDDRGEDTSIIIEYDGQYCPTVDELLSGKLYIVIKSGELEPQKIYFNNKFLPTLFINDDKYPNNIEKYILEGQQTMKLCDICMFQKLGCQIIWDEELIKLVNIKYIKKLVYEKICSDLGYSSNPDECPVQQKDIYFKFYFHVKVKLNTATTWHYIIYYITNNRQPAQVISTNKFIDWENEIDNNNLDIQDNSNLNENYNIFLNPFTNNNTTGKLTIGSVINIPCIILEMSMGVSLILKGFSPIPPSLVKKYTLSWYDYVEDDGISMTVLIYNIIISGASNVKINDVDISNEVNSVKFSDEPGPVLSTYYINIDIPEILKDNIQFSIAGYTNSPDNIEKFTPIEENGFESTKIYHKSQEAYTINKIADGKTFQILKSENYNIDENIFNSGWIDLKGFTIEVNNTVKTISNIYLNIHMHIDNPTNNE